MPESVSGVKLMNRLFGFENVIIRLTEAPAANDPDGITVR